MFINIVVPLSFSQCGGTSAVRGFIDHVTGPGRDTELFIMGADCSVASEPIASLAPFWNLAQVITIFLYEASN